MGRRFKPALLVVVLLFVFFVPSALATSADDQAASLKSGWGWSSSSARYPTGYSGSWFYYVLEALRSVYNKIEDVRSLVSTSNSYLNTISTRVNTTNTNLSNIYSRQGSILDSVDNFDGLFSGWSSSGIPSSFSSSWFGYSLVSLRNISLYTSQTKSVLDNIYSSLGSLKINDFSGLMSGWASEFSSPDVYGSSWFYRVADRLDWIKNAGQNIYYVLIDSGILHLNQYNTSGDGKYLWNIDAGFTGVGNYPSTVANGSWWYNCLKLLADQKEYNIKSSDTLSELDSWLFRSLRGTNRAYRTAQQYSYEASVGDNLSWLVSVLNNNSWMFSGTSLGGLPTFRTSSMTDPSGYSSQNAGTWWSTVLTLLSANNLTGLTVTYDNNGHFNSPGSNTTLNKIKNSPFDWLFHSTWQLQQVLASDKDLELHNAQQDNINELSNDVLSGKDSNKSLGVNGIKGITGVLGNVSDSLSTGVPVSSSGDVLSAGLSADGGLGLFSAEVYNELQPSSGDVSLMSSAEPDIIDFYSLNQSSLAGWLDSHG